MRNLIALFLLLGSSSLLAQTPYLVKDINTTYSTTTKSSTPREFAAFHNRIFFTATTDDAGTELWSTDGTSAGTSMVADILPGSASSAPYNLKVVNGVFLFTARDVNHGIELWTTDGTAAGTHLFLDLNPGPSSAQPTFELVSRNRMYFSADDGVNGREPWITDGTPAGTHRLADINPGSGSSGSAYYAAFGNSVYFTAMGGLWKTDGTESGTVLLAPVTTATQLVAAGTRLFFAGWSAETGWEPWVSDGSAAGTHLVADVLPGTRGSLEGSSFYSPVGDRVFFIANDGTHGRELWVSDGSVAGTHLVHDFLPGAKGQWDSYSSIYIAPVAGRGFFTASDEAHGQELWVTDGTEEGTSLFLDLLPGPGTSYPNSLAVMNGKLYFSAVDAIPLGFRLWESDGTVAGTHMITGNVGGLGLAVSSGSLAPVDGRLYFGGQTALTGTEPWVTDGTDAGTHMIANLAADGPPSSSPFLLTATRDLLFFYATEGTIAPSNISEYSFWRSDGTAAGTFKLREAGQHADNVTAIGPSVLFSTNISDGTVAGTKPAADFLARFGKSPVEEWFPFGDTLFARVNDADIYDGSLWMTSAAPNAATIRLGSRNPYNMIEVGSHYDFLAEGPSGVYDYGIWTTDGTVAGTHALVNDLGDTDTVSPLVNAGGTLYFFKKLHTDTNTKLWKSDGTLDGTTVVKEIPAASSFGAELRTAGHRLFFTLFTGSSYTRDLWTSDGTEAGTIKIATINTLSQQNLIAVGNRLIVVQYDHDAGTTELWTSDGTPEGTKLLRALGRITAPPVSIDGLLYFQGTDDQHGTELWTSDGTPEGTSLLVDVTPGPGSSWPAYFTKVGNLLYFTASDDQSGTELWAMPLDEPRLSVHEAEAPEGGTVRFNVSLSPAPTRTVTVDYATADGSAHAGDDYDAASGTLSFAPGETAKTIDVHTRADAVPENNETFYLALRNANGARVATPERAGLINDDDQAADVSVSVAFGDTLSDAVTVANAGPRGATDIAFTLTSTPSAGNTYCFGCGNRQLPTGGSALFYSGSDSPFAARAMSAIVSARQRDPQPSNNATAWMINGYRTIVMNAAYLTVGGTAMVTARPNNQTPVITSSDPTVISVPSSLAMLKPGLGTFTVTGLRPGTSTINVDGQPYPLVVSVVAPGERPRWPGAVGMGTDYTVRQFQQPLTVSVIPSGVAPLSGAVPTGTVLVTSGSEPELARRAFSGSEKFSFTFYPPAVGQVFLTLSYSGDANFLPQQVNTSVFINPGQITLTARLLETGTPGRYGLTVTADGSPRIAPFGTISVRNAVGQQLATLTLFPVHGEPSYRTGAGVVLESLPAGAILTLSYSGDSHYSPATQQVRYLGSKRRAAGR